MHQLRSCAQTCADVRAHTCVGVRVWPIGCVHSPTPLAWPPPGGPVPPFAKDPKLLLERQSSVGLHAPRRLVVRALQASKAPSYEIRLPKARTYAEREFGKCSRCECTMGGQACCAGCALVPDRGVEGAVPPVLAQPQCPRQPAGAIENE